MYVSGISMSPEANKITSCVVVTHQLTMVSSFFESIQILRCCTNTYYY